MILFWRLRERIKNLDYYVLGVAAHRLTAKETTIEYVGPLDELKGVGVVSGSTTIRELIGSVNTAALHRIYAGRRGLSGNRTCTKTSPGASLKPTLKKMVLAIQLRRLTPTPVSTLAY